ncbi:MAG TPA: hypothetical protein VG722_04545, partial [Tepidisphaeraceae bacterium]|nr:hypothetical protein [Tepidisphaeraceae bacterium]
IIEIEMNGITTMAPKHFWHLGQWKQSTIHIRIDDFRWNMPLDDSLFDVTPPTGYQVHSGVNVRFEILK